MDTLHQDAPLKQCTGPCGRTLPSTAEFFHRHKKTKDGLREKCKECRKQADSQFYQEHREEINKRSKAYRGTHRKEISDYRRKYREEHHQEILDKANKYRETHREELREKASKYNQEHREEHKAYHYCRREELNEKSRKYYQSHRKEHAAYSKVYYQSPRGRMVLRAGHQNRRARKKAVPGSYTPAQIQEQLKRQRYRCYYAACGHAKFEKKNGKYIFHIDHTIPISRTEHNPHNDINHVVLACPSCNLSKGDKLPSEWPAGGRLI